MLRLSKSEITCPTFLSKEASIGTLIRSIYETDSFQDKTRRTYEFLEEIECLSNCSHLDKRKEQCKMCQRICRFRKQTANQTLGL